jgi:hypothetical protein
MLKTTASRRPQAPTSRPLRVQNLVSACAHVQAALHQIVGDNNAAGLRADHPQIVQLLERIRAHAAQVESICTRSHSSPGVLPTPSRRAYQWLKYLSVPENLLAQLATLAEAHRIIAQMKWLRAGEFAQHAVEFELSHGNYLFSMRPAGSTTSAQYAEQAAKNAGRVERAGHTLRISAAQGFSSAPPVVLEALIKAALSRRQRKARAVVKAYASGEDYVEAALAFELAAALPQPDVRGRHHDLAQSFARVNAANFSGRLTPPRLTWSRTITRRIMGYYQAERDTVMLSLTLDRGDVPAHVVDYVMYHELLHRELGVPLVNGRRRPHGRVFRAAERKFGRYAEAEAFLKQLAGDAK